MSSSTVKISENLTIGIVPIKRTGNMGLINTDKLHFIDVGNDECLMLEQRKYMRELKFWLHTLFPEGRTDEEKEYFTRHPRKRRFPPTIIEMKVCNSRSWRACRFNQYKTKN